MASFEQQRARMVERQLRARGIRDPRVLAAMGEVPREAFVPEPLRASAYDDGPLPIGEGQTISQPYVVALMLEAAGIAPGDRVLEVGAGSGYAAAVASLVAGQVWAVERHATLAEAARGRLAHLGFGNVTVVAGDGCLGLPAIAPFEAILVAAASPTVPEPLKRQLAVGGRLVAPVGGVHQSLVRLARTGDAAWSEHDLGAVRFVPLVGGAGR